MAWDIRNLFQPVSPGMSGAINPLAFIGAGMATGDPGGQLARMGQLHMQGQQGMLNQQMLAMKQQEAERKAKQRDAMLAIAPGVAKEIFPDNPNMQGLLAMNPGLMQAAMKQRMKMNQPPSILSNAQAYMGASPEMQAVMDKLRPGPSTVINTGMGSIPSGFMRQAAEQGGTQLVPEPGGPESVKRAATLASRQAMVSDLTELESLVKEHGTESFGEVSRRMKSLTARVMGNIQTMRETGVLQEGEAKRLEEELGDPTSLFRTGRQALPSIRAMREEAQRKLDDLGTMYGQGAAETVEAGAPTLPGAPTQPQPPTEIANDDEYRALPPGALYRGPDGVLRKK